jgi:hypothetical protein
VEVSDLKGSTTFTFFGSKADKLLAKPASSYNCSNSEQCIRELRAAVNGVMFEQYFLLMRSKRIVTKEGSFGFEQTVKDLVKVDETADMLRLASYLRATLS